MSRWTCWCTFSFSFSPSTCQYELSLNCSLHFVFFQHPPSLYVCFLPPHPHPISLCVSISSLFIFLLEFSTRKRQGMGILAHNFIDTGHVMSMTITFMVNNVCRSECIGFNIEYDCVICNGYCARTIIERVCRQLEPVRPIHICPHWPGSTMLAVQLDILTWHPWNWHWPSLNSETSHSILQIPQSLV